MCTYILHLLSEDPEHHTCIFKTPQKESWVRLGAFACVYASLSVSICVCKSVYVCVKSTCRESMLSRRVYSWKASCHSCYHS